jgi:putative toxin-antitoxin system antitoxin component (TIGR02293 family)
MATKKVSKTTGSSKAKSQYATKTEASHPKVADALVAYAYREKEKVIDFMGMDLKHFAFERKDETYFIEVIRKGIPKKIIDHLMQRIGLSEDEMAGILHVSKRTLQRRAPKEILNAVQTERIIELAKVYSKGEEILGDSGQFADWMDQKLLSLGHKRPKDFLDTSIGIRILLDELGRIEHGVYS